MKIVEEFDGNKIILGDCLEVMKTFKDKTVDYSFTSPPYNRKRNDKYENFIDVNKNWLELNINVLNELLRITKKHIFYNIQANFYNRNDVYKLIGYFNEKL